MISIFTDREHAAILAGLRTLQVARIAPYGVQINSPEWTGICDIGTNGHTLDPLSLDEIDRLCEHINFCEPETRLLDYICDELAGIVMNHIIDGVVLTKDAIELEIRGWDEPYTIPLGDSSGQAA